MTEDELFAKGYDIGKRDAEQKQSGEIERLRARVKLLEAWLEGDAYCPCCTGTRVCEEGCTFADDHPVENQMMLEVRAVLYGNDEGVPR